VLAVLGFLLVGAATIVAVARAFIHPTPGTGPPLARRDR
jgi:hypothetical protein